MVDHTYILIVCYGIPYMETIARYEYFRNQVQEVWHFTTSRVLSPLVAEVPSGTSGLRTPDVMRMEVWLNYTS